jgi:spoIIIJ-associated protein
MISSKYRSNLKFEIDINEYIKKKIVKLKQFAKEISIKAKNEHRSIKLRPMYPNERRIIHVTLKNDKHIRTESVGNGEKKRIIISPTEQ